MVSRVGRKVSRRDMLWRCQWAEQYASGIHQAQKRGTVLILLSAFQTLSMRLLPTPVTLPNATTHLVEDTASLAEEGHAGNDASDVRDRAKLGHER